MRCKGLVGILACGVALAGLAAPGPAAADVVEKKLTEMGIELPEPRPPVANYVRAVRTGNLVFLAGHGPVKPDGDYVTGKLGKDLTVEQGYEAARLTAIALLASLKQEIGDLDKVTRIVRVFGMVNSTPTFVDQPAVINGASDLLVEVFGEKRGKHARAAVGMASLPIGIAVEIEMVVEVLPTDAPPWPERIGAEVTIERGPEHEETGQTTFVCRVTLLDLDSEAVLAKPTVRFLAGEVAEMKVGRSGEVSGELLVSVSADEKSGTASFRLSRQEKGETVVLQNLQVALR